MTATPNNSMDLRANQRLSCFAKQQGKFKPDMFQSFDRLQIVTVQQILDGERMNLPLMEEVTKKDDQPTLLSE